MRQTLPIAAILLILAASAGCSRSEAAPVPSGGAQPALSRTPNGPLPRLVFFMNPNGQPCRTQKGILDDMAAELNGKVEVVYYKTTSPKDVDMFDQYGIRSLPALVLTDSLGNELRRATPGIQDTGSVRRLIAQ